MVFILDKTSKEIGDRPLISGTIFLKKAWIFVSASMLGAFIIAFYVAFTIQNFVACPENVTNWGCRGCKLLYK